MLSGMMPGAPSEATINRRLANNKDVVLCNVKNDCVRLAERKARELEKNTELKMLVKVIENAARDVARKKRKEKGRK